MVSLYIDQVGPLDSATGNFAALDDLGVGFAEKYGARLCGSIAEALWCARLLLHFTPPHHTLIRPYSAFAMKRFWTPFSRPFRDRFGPFFGVLVPVSGILGARRRKKGEKTT